MCVACIGDRVVACVCTLVMCYLTVAGWRLCLLVSKFAFGVGLFVRLCVCVCVIVCETLWLYLCTLVVTS